MFAKRQIAAALSVIALNAATLSLATAAPVDAGTALVPSFGNRLNNVSITGNVDQVYFFNLATAAGGLTASWNWDPTGPTNVQGTFYQSNSSGDLLGASLGSFGAQNNDAIRFMYGALDAGYYAFRFTAEHNAGAGYSGQFTTYVPAPGVLALLGIGLIGMGATRRKVC